MDDEEDDFYDTTSLNSLTSVTRRKANNNSYVSLSRNTIYHSAIDLDMEMVDISNNKRHNKTWKHFSKGSYCVDFVLAYEDTNNPDHIKKRNIFERNLEYVGLLLEKEENQSIHFIKVHAPREVLCRYAEILKLRLPIKDITNGDQQENFFKSMISNLLDFFHVRVDPNKFPPHKYKLTAEFSRDKNYLFDVDTEDFFNVAVRITIVSYILHREKFGDEDQDKGIKKLLSHDVYKAAYPLHDGNDTTVGSTRKLLCDEWAAVSKCIKYQPIDEIKDYFGAKYALYFAWLGFYTHMLIPAAIVGILCVLYGWLTLSSDVISQDICKLDITMCPLCDKYCDYWKLNDTCTFSKISYVIDNPATIFFAIFMSLWAALYLELWKRYSAEIMHRWGLTGFDLQAEPPRPEYLTRLADAKKNKMNVVTRLAEPVVPFWKVKLPSIILSFAVALFWIFLAVAVVFGIVIYRMSLFTSDVLYSETSSYRSYVVPITGAVLNLISIFILNYFYEKLAQWLTEMELQRTQTEYDESLALKIYMFQFVNFYTCIFYIAFLKGKFVGYPMKYNRVFGYRQEECSPGGCLIELTIQLAIIMIGKQAINAIFEMVVPFLVKIYNTFRLTTGYKDSTDTLVSCNQWTEDYKLSEIEPRGLFYEYLEMVLQYGFVTIFVTAFPLAPLFALINNIFEMRLDAKKIIKYYRRPIPQRIKNIGIWFPIMDIIGRISVVSNAFIIAFSSHFIPKLVYEMKINPNHTDIGFLENSLAYFNTSDFPGGTAPVESNYNNVTICRYAEYRNPPEHEFKYKRPVEYWHILAARLAFVVVYQNVVGCVITAVQWAIPDMPRKLGDQIKREAYRTNELIIQTETEKAKERMNQVISDQGGSNVNGKMHGDGTNGLHYFVNTNDDSLPIV